MPCRHLVTRPGHGSSECLCAQTFRSPLRRRRFPRRSRDAGRAYRIPLESVSAEATCRGSCYRSRPEPSQSVNAHKGCLWGLKVPLTFVTCSFRELCFSTRLRTIRSLRRDMSDRFTLRAFCLFTALKDSRTKVLTLILLTSGDPRGCVWYSLPTVGAHRETLPGKRRRISIQICLLERQMRPSVSARRVFCIVDDQWRDLPPNLDRGIPYLQKADEHVVLTL